MGESRVSMKPGPSAGPGSLRRSLRALGDQGGHHAATAAWSPTGMPTTAGGRPAAVPATYGCRHFLRPPPPSAGVPGLGRRPPNSSPVGLVGQGGRGLTPARRASLSSRFARPALRRPGRRLRAASGSVSGTSAGPSGHGVPSERSESRDERGRAAERTRASLGPAERCREPTPSEARSHRAEGPP